MKLNKQIILFDQQHSFDKYLNYINNFLFYLVLNWIKEKCWIITQLNL